jgi:hypothetical protein
MVRPVGRLGETLYVSVPVPPEPVTGVNEVAAWFSVRVVVATTVVAVGEFPIVSVRLPVLPA